MRADSFDPIMTARLDTARSNLMLSPRLGSSIHNNNNNNTSQQQYSPASSSLHKQKYSGDHHSSSSSSNNHNYSNLDHSCKQGQQQSGGYNAQNSNNSGRASVGGGYTINKHLSNIDENSYMPSVPDADHEDNGSELEDNDSIYRSVGTVVVVSALRCCSAVTPLWLYHILCTPLLFSSFSFFSSLTYLHSFLIYSYSYHASSLLFVSLEGTARKEVAVR